MKQFVFLYPIPEFIESNIELGMKLCRAKSKPDLARSYRHTYKSRLNDCIDSRYRKEGFTITYAVFNRHEISDVIELRPADRIIEVGLDFKTHTTKQPYGEYTYPDQDYILNQLNEASIIRIAGFHMWDCVEKLAKRAYERRLDVLVDEDLTEFFSGMILRPDFKLDTFPGRNPRTEGEGFFEMFMLARKDKPWLWQEY